MQADNKTQAERIELHDTEMAQLIGRNAELVKQEIILRTQLKEIHEKTFVVERELSGLKATINVEGNVTIGLKGLRSDFRDLRQEATKQTKAIEQQLIKADIASRERDDITRQEQEHKTRLHQDLQRLLRLDAENLKSLLKAEQDNRALQVGHLNSIIKDLQLEVIQREDDRRAVLSLAGATVHNRDLVRGMRYKFHNYFNRLHVLHNFRDELCAVLDETTGVNAPTTRLSDKMATHAIEQDMRRIRVQLNALILQRDHCKTKEGHLRQDNSRLTKDIEEVRQKCEDAEQRLEVNSLVLDDERKHWNERSQTSQQTVDRLREEIDIRDKEEKRLQKKNTGLTDDLASSVKEVRKLNVKCADQTRLSDCQHNQLKIKYREWQEKTKSLQEVASSWETKWSTKEVLLGSKIAALAITTADIKKLRQDYQVAVDRVATGNTKVQQLTDMAKRALCSERNFQSEKTRADDAESSLKVIQDENTRLDRVLRQNQILLSHNPALRAQLATAVARATEADLLVESLRGEKTALEDKLTATCDHNIAVDETIILLEDEKKTCRVEISRLQQIVNRLKTQLENVQAEVAEAEDIRQSPDSLANTGHNRGATNESASERNFRIPRSSHQSAYDVDEGQPGYLDTEGTKDPSEGNPGRSTNTQHDRDSASIASTTEEPTDVAAHNQSNRASMKRKADTTEAKSRSSKISKGYTLQDIGWNLEQLRDSVRADPASPRVWAIVRTQLEEWIRQDPNRVFSVRGKRVCAASYVLHKSTVWVNGDEDHTCLLCKSTGQVCLAVQGGTVEVLPFDDKKSMVDMRHWMTQEGFERHKDIE